MQNRLKTGLLTLLAVGMCIMGISQIKYTPDEVRMTIDYSALSQGSSLSGPAFGVSWLMQNRFMNTFDFAVGHHQLKDYSSTQKVTLRYQFMYIPDNGLGRLKTGIGIGVNRTMGDVKSMGFDMLGKIKYPFYQTYFVELIVPYNLYRTGIGDFNPIGTETKFKTFKGLNLETRRFSTVRVGIGVSF